MSTIGLDVGTSRVKAVRFDDDWKAADVAAESNQVLRGADGRREQDMLAVWDAASRVLETVARRSPDPITLVAVTAQGDGCWLIDDAGQPTGPALLWNDSRCIPIIDRWNRDGRLGAAFAVNGCQGAPGLAHAQLVWLREHQPETLVGATELLSCGSWIYHQLTGRRVLESSDAANPFCDATTHDYAPDLLDLFEIGEFRRLLPPIVAATDRVADLRPELADVLGLSRSTKVTLAPYDVPATAIGTGVVATDLAFAVLGTTLCVGRVSDDPLLTRHPNGMSLPGVADDQWLIAYATMVGTEVLDWTAALLGLPDAAAVTELAATSTHSDPPVVLPYLSAAGERSPFLDTTVRGSITGLDTSHGPADIAQATVVALSLVVKDCLNAAGTPELLVLSGGGAASDLWCQNISDAVGIPTVRPDVSEIGALGAVISGATDLGIFDDIHAAVSTAVRTGRTFEPDPDRGNRYELDYGRLLTARHNLSERS